MRTPARIDNGGMASLTPASLQSETTIGRPVAVAAHCRPYVPHLNRPPHKRLLPPRSRAGDGSGSRRLMQPTPKGMGGTAVAQPIPRVRECWEVLPPPLTPDPSRLASHGLTPPKAVCYAPRRLAPIVGKTEPHEY